MYAAAEDDSEDIFSQKERGTTTRRTACSFKMVRIPSKLEISTNSPPRFASDILMRPTSGDYIESAILRPNASTPRPSKG